MRRPDKTAHRLLFQLMYLSIIIPAYNEALRLPKTLPGVREYLLKQDYEWEVVLVDDGSDDNTIEVFQGIFAPEEGRVVKNPGNRGKGYSVRQGTASARGEVLLISDADFSTPVWEFENLRAILDQGYDIVIGSRSLPKSNVTKKQAWYRQGMGRVFNQLVQWVALEGFVDTQCGFKLFRCETSKPIFSRMTIDRFSFDVEILYIAQKRGLKIKEVPVEWENMLYSRVHIVRDSLRMLLDLFLIRRNDRKGIYD